MAMDLQPRGTRWPIGLVAGILLSAFGVALVVPVASAQDTTVSLDIYAAACPEDYERETYFDDCFPTPGEGVRFRVDDPSYRATGADGWLSYTFDWPREGFTVVVLPPEGDNRFYDLPLAYCASNGDRLPVGYPDTNAAGPVVTIEIGDATAVQCDFYLVPRGAGDAESDIRVTTLPETGAGPGTFRQFHRLP